MISQRPATPASRSTSVARPTAASSNRMPRRSPTPTPLPPSQERRRQPRPDLTERQRQVLDLLAAGHTNGQIARRLGVSEGTIRTHLEHIYRRLGVTSRTAAVTHAFG